MSTERALRTTARVVPVSPDGAVLLLLEQDPARPGELYWSTIGGALDEGEPHRDAAVRELLEETGVEVAAPRLVGPFHHRRTEFSWNGVDYLADATVFAVALGREAEISFDRLEAEEVGNVLEARWMLPSEAAADGRLMWPDLADVLVEAVEAVRAAEEAELGEGRS